MQASHSAGKIRLIPTIFPASLSALLKKCLTFTSIDRFKTWKDVSDEVISIYITITEKPVPQEIQSAETNSDERTRKSWSYNSIGRAYMDIGAANVSLPYFLQALEIAKTEDVKELIGVSLFNLGFANKDLGNVLLAVDDYKRALEIFQTMNNLEGQSAVLSGLGSAYLNLGKSKEAITFLRKHSQFL